MNNLKAVTLWVAAFLVYVVLMGHFRDFFLRIIVAITLYSEDFVVEIDKVFYPYFIALALFSCKLDKTRLVVFHFRRNLNIFKIVFIFKIVLAKKICYVPLNFALLQIAVGAFAGLKFTLDKMQIALSFFIFLYYCDIGFWIHHKSLQYESCSLCFRVRHHTSVAE